MNSIKKTREFLQSVGLPRGDAYDLPTSEKRFADGGQYRFEVPGIQGPKVMQALLEAMDGYGLYLHRVTQTQGIMRLTDEEISKMMELAHNGKPILFLPSVHVQPQIHLHRYIRRKVCAWGIVCVGRSRLSVLLRM